MKFKTGKNGCRYCVFSGTADNTRSLMIISLSILKLTSFTKGKGDTITNEKFVLFSKKHRKIRVFIKNERKSFQALPFSKISGAVGTFTNGIGKGSKQIAQYKSSVRKAITLFLMNEVEEWHGPKIKSPSKVNHGTLIAMLNYPFLQHIKGTEESLLRPTPSRLILFPNRITRRYIDGCTTATELTRKLVHRNDKRITKAIGEDMSKAVGIAQFILIFRRLIPIENIAGAIHRDVRVCTKIARETTIGAMNLTSIVKVISLLSKKVIMETISLDPVDCFLLRDTLTQYYQMQKLGVTPDIRDKWSSLNDLHDHLSRLYRRLKTANIEIKIPKKWESINGAIVGDMRIDLPKDTHTIVDWSETMENCIASYARRMATGETILLAVTCMKTNEMKYNIEIRDQTLTQFRARKNSNPESMDAEKIASFLKQHKLISKYDYYVN